MIITHGWPSTVNAFLDIVGAPTDPSSHSGEPGQAFHVVARSIPVFCLLRADTSTGWNVNRIARVWDELTRRLGYERFGAQGGDYGSLISAELGRADIALDKQHSCGSAVPFVISGERSANTR